MNFLWGLKLLFYIAFSYFSMYTLPFLFISRLIYDGSTVVRICDGFLSFKLFSFLFVPFLFLFVDEPAGPIDRDASGAPRAQEDCHHRLPKSQTRSNSAAWVVDRLSFLVTGNSGTLCSAISQPRGNVLEVSSVRLET